jgi:hypothetical protein
MAARPTFQATIEAVYDTYTGEAFRAEETPLSNFLIHYFTCEVMAKLVQGAANRSSPSQALRKSVTPKRLRNAAEALDLKIDDRLLVNIFDTTQSPPEELSSRKLRDGVVHWMLGPYFAEVKSRSRPRCRQMKAFIDRVHDARWVMDRP